MNDFLSPRGIRIGLITIFVWVGLAWVYFTVTEIPVVQVENAVMTEKVRQGEDIVIRARVFRSKSCESNSERIMFDGKGMRTVFQSLHFLSAPGPIGVVHEYIQKIPVPAYAAPGKGQFFFNLVYQCPPFYIDVRQSVGPILFEIVDGKGAEVTP